MRRITTVAQIIRLADEGRAVVYRQSKPKAAAFFQNFQARFLHNEIKSGCFFEYPNPKTRGTT
jgi:hypothetical protein